MWGADDTLIYLGTILGAIATISAVVMTINHSKAQLREDRRLSISPYLEIDYQCCTASEFYDKQVENPLYVFIDPSGSISYSKEMPDEIKNELETVMLVYNSENELDKINNRYFFLDYTYANVGAGNAIDFNVKHDSLSVIENSSIRVNGKRNIRYIFDMSLFLKNQRKTINIVYKYSDVASIGSYVQKEKLHFTRDRDSEMIYCSQINSDFLSPQELIT